MAKPKKIPPEIRSRAILTAFKRSDDIAFKGKMVAEMLKLHRTFIFAVFNRTIGRNNPYVVFPYDIDFVVNSCYMYDATFKAMRDFTMETKSKFLTFYVWRVRWGCNKLLGENHVKALVHKPHQVINRTGKNTVIANEHMLEQDFSNNNNNNNNTDSDHSSTDIFDRISMTKTPWLYFHGSIEAEESPAVNEFLERIDNSKRFTSNEKQMVTILVDYGRVSMTYGDLSILMNISKERVRQVYNSLLEKLVDLNLMSTCSQGFARIA